MLVYGKTTPHLARSLESCFALELLSPASVFLDKVAKSEDRWLAMSLTSAVNRSPGCGLSHAATREKAVHRHLAKHRSVSFRVVALPAYENHFAGPM